LDLVFIEMFSLWHDRCAAVVPQIRDRDLASLAVPEMDYASTAGSGLSISCSEGPARIVGADARRAPDGLLAGGAAVCWLRPSAGGCSPHHFTW
jgi:hypothetical protein